MDKIHIMLDAGHAGKYNRSPVVPEYYESDFTWKFHLLLKSELEEYGFEVGTTRDDKNVDLEVTQRGKKSKGYDLFLSLHSDGFDNPNANHVSVFGAYDDFNNAHVLGEMLAQNVANCIGVKGYYKTNKSTNGDWEYYGVLRGARSVGCPLYYIIEHGFHTNKYDAEWLMNDDNLALLAEIEADTIAQYYGIEKPLIVGDVDGNGKVDVTDYALAKRICLGTYEPTDDELKRCDVDGDGKVSATDYILIKRMCLGTYKPKGV